MRVGLLYMGDETSEIWGSAVTTYYLGQALRRHGVDVWRASASQGTEWLSQLQKDTDVIVAEGVPSDRIPSEVWDNTKMVLWSLSALFYGGAMPQKFLFDAVAVNSAMVQSALAKSGILSSHINLAAPEEFYSVSPTSRYKARCVYLGCYPHKSEEQMQMLLGPAQEFGLDLWGYGWENSPYAAHHRGVLPFADIAPLYHSTEIVLALTEQRQKNMGMINNRIYEALICGAVVLSDPHPALMESELGESIVFVDSEKAASNFLQNYFSDPTFAACVKQSAEKGRLKVLARHTYAARAKQFLELFRTLLSSTQDRPSMG